MSIPNAEETLPTLVEKASDTKPKRWPWITGGVVLMLAIAAVGAYFGYNEAIRERLYAQTSQVTMEATTQYQLGLQDQAAQRYDIARQRFEYVIRLDPNFPGAREKLAEVMLAASWTATPTQAPTPTEVPKTPTPDLRGADELFAQAHNLLAQKDWSRAIDTLDSLRKINVTYRAIEVDDMYYIALRYRGADKILKEGHLMEGTYDLSLAERFGPLDGEANGYRVWANLYLTGASFWQVDWAKVVYYFGQVYPYYPGLRDTTGMTATERFRLGNVGLGDDAMKKNDPCSAEKSYKAALELSPDPKVDEKANAAGRSCQATNTPPTSTVSPFTPTPSLTPEGPAATTAVPTEAVPTEAVPTQVTPEPPAATETPTPTG